MAGLAAGSTQSPMTHKRSHGSTLSRSILEITAALLREDHGELPIAHGPIRIVVLVREDEHVLRRDTGALLQVGCDLCVESFLHGIASAAPHCDLDDDQVIRAGNAIERARI